MDFLRIYWATPVGDSPCVQFMREGKALEITFIQRFLKTKRAISLELKRKLYT